jgi:hypothetical protein
MRAYKSASRTLDDVVRNYVETHGRTRAISTADAIRAVRTLLPDIGLHDRELSDKVAEMAMLAGYAVAFDAPAKTD